MCKVGPYRPPPPHLFPPDMQSIARFRMAKQRAKAKTESEARLKALCAGLEWCRTKGKGSRAAVAAGVITPRYRCSLQRALTNRAPIESFDGSTKHPRWEVCYLTEAEEKELVRAISIYTRGGVSLSKATVCEVARSMLYYRSTREKVMQIRKGTFKTSHKAREWRDSGKKV